MWEGERERGQVMIKEREGKETERRESVGERERGGGGKEIEYGDKGERIKLEKLNIIIDLRMKYDILYLKYNELSIVADGIKCPIIFQLPGKLVMVTKYYP